MIHKSFIEAQDLLIMDVLVISSGIGAIKTKNRTFNSEKDKQI